MSSEIVAFLSRYIPISEELAELFEKSQFVRSFPKGTILLRQGEIARQAYFVLKGCIRSYVLKEGEEKTLEFYVEEDAVLPIDYGKGQPSVHWLECQEETLAVASSPEEERRTLAAYPELKAVCLSMSELMSEKLQESLARYKVSSPEERYRQLIERRPDLLRRIPQYQLASYLGLQPESLSRIRKRLSLQRKERSEPDRS